MLVNLTSKWLSAAHTDLGGACARIGANCNTPSVGPHVRHGHVSAGKPCCCNTVPLGDRITRFAAQGLPSSSRRTRPRQRNGANFVLESTSVPISHRRSPMALLD